MGSKAIAIELPIITNVLRDRDRESHHAKRMRDRSRERMIARLAGAGEQEPARRLDRVWRRTGRR
jgi:hypothetical protein